jgi:hypothetical protein
MPCFVASHDAVPPAGLKIGGKLGIGPFMGRHGARFIRCATTVKEFRTINREHYATL